MTPSWSIHGRLGWEYLLLVSGWPVRVINYLLYQHKITCIAIGKPDQASHNHTFLSQTKLDTQVKISFIVCNSINMGIQGFPQALSDGQSDFRILISDPFPICFQSWGVRLKFHKMSVWRGTKHFWRSFESTNPLWLFNAYFPFSLLFWFFMLISPMFCVCQHIFMGGQKVFWPPTVDD